MHLIDRFGSLHDLAGDDLFDQARALEAIRDEENVCIGEERGERILEISGGFFVGGDDEPGAAAIEHQSGQGKGFSAAGQSGHPYVCLIRQQSLLKQFYSRILTIQVNQPLQVRHGKPKVSEKRRTKSEE